MKGWLLGANGRYYLSDAWYISARAGWLRDSIDATYRYSDPVRTDVASGSADGNGWYGGVGLGYAFANGSSVGLEYDLYHATADTPAGRVDGHISAFLATYRYRF